MMNRSAIVLLALAVTTGTGCRTEAPQPAPPASAGADIVLVPDTALVRGLIPPNTTLDGLLRSHGLGSGVAAGVIDASRRVFDPRRLRAGQAFSLLRTIEGEVRHLEYEIDAASFLRVEPAPEGGELVAAVLPIPRQREEAALGGHIHSGAPSLFQAMEEAGERAELSVVLAGIFSGEIDFNTELQPGDRFGLVFEKFTREEGPTTYGDVTAAEFRNDGRVLRAFRFTPPGGQPGYYDDKGRSLRRFFLRSPLKFEPRITSGFSRRRFHPVLQTYRAHLGVDYGAPTGAPVVAVSSGSVISATYDRANGRMVRLRHSSGYETYYLHLSAFAPGIRAGARVTQGQVIGRVGATGLASGPHLDYRLRKNGTFVNPLAEHRRMPPGEPIPAGSMPAFEEIRDREAVRLRQAVEVVAQTTS